MPDMRPVTIISSLTAICAAIGVAAILGACAPDVTVPPIAPPITSVTTQPSRIAITVDDLPYVTYGKATPAQGLRFATSINTALRAHQITATGFVIGGQINAKSRPALQAFADGGHTIGNHSWSHPDYNTLTVTQFEEETRRTDEVLSDWIKGPRYYRFPYLKEGASEAAKTAATDVLTRMGYQNVPATIDNDEWKYNADYVDALANGNADAAQDIARAYIAHMQERTAFFQKLAQSQLGDDVDHILLIHLNRINADHLTTLLDWYAVQGWRFITVTEALAHPLFEQPDIYTGPRGLSQIERVIGRKAE